MKEQITDIGKDWLTLGLTGLGITFAPHQYIGGMFLSLAGASLAWRMSAERDQRKFWLVMLTAWVAAHVAAILAARWWPDFSMQLVMAAAGFASRWLVQFAVRLLDRATFRGDELADRVIDRILPKNNKEPKE